MPLIATHFFVFHFRVLADVTPPVALAAYAAAGLARSDPMQTGTSAFRLSMGKELVPFIFIYAPSVLFVNFTLVGFTSALVSGIVCIIALSAAYIGHFKTNLTSARNNRQSDAAPTRFALNLRYSGKAERARSFCVVVGPATRTHAKHTPISSFPAAP